MIVLISSGLFILLGWSLVRRMFAGVELLPIERLCYTMMTGALVWLATSWLLALLRVLTLPFLSARLLIVIAAIVLLERGRSRPRLIGSRAAMIMIAGGIPIVLWTVFIIWRGAVIPPVSHDALAYHLPKATLMARDGGYRHLDFLNPALRPLPVNYELLLAEVIVWTGRDDSTELVSVIFYLLFVISCGALAERMWRRSGVPVIAVMVLVAAIPVVLLHSGAHKNDLMIAAFTVAALVAAGRWIAENQPNALALAVASFAAAAGTKPQAGLVAICLAPAIVVGLWRRAQWRTALALILFAIIAFLLLGGAVYVTNVIHERSLLNARQSGGEMLQIVPYGSWRGLWEGPYVLLAAPFSSSAYALTVPGYAHSWFWRRYEMYFSHLGRIFALCAIAAPLAAWWSRGLAPEARTERRSITAAAIVAFVFMLPVEFLPHGLYTISLPRYALFIVPIVFGWTLVPLLVRLEGRSPIIAVIAGIAVPIVVFSVNAFEYAARDTFMPFDYVLWARKHPGTRSVPFDPYRAACVADRRAGPADRIAIDGGFGTWIHPAFGADLSRPVTFITAETDPHTIAGDVKWVVIDRAYNIVWGHPAFHDLSEARKYLLRGTPKPDDTRVFDALRRDNRFQLVYYNPRMMQAVFRRVR